MNNSFTEIYVRYVKYARIAVTIELTYICPLQCPFCDRQDERLNTKQIIKRNNHIPTEDFKKVISYFSKFYFCGQISDPIYHPKFLELIKLSSEYQHKNILIYTTATRKSTDWWKEVFSHSHKNIVWSIGLDGTDQETANIYRVNTRFEEVMDVMKLGVFMGANIEWHFIVFKHNEHQINNVLEIAKQNNITVRICKSSRWRPRDIKKFNIHPPSKQWTTTWGEKQFILIKPI